MPFQIPCTSCGQAILVMEQQAGQVASCPSCGAQVMVPPPGGQFAAPQGGFTPAPPGGQQFVPPGGFSQPQAGGYQFNSSGFAPQGSPVMGGGMGSRLVRGLGGVLGFILLLVLLNVVSWVFNCGWVFY